VSPSSSSIKIPLSKLIFSLYNQPASVPIPSQTMRLLIDIMLLIVKLLTAIGDFVFLVFRLFKKKKKKKKIKPIRIFPLAFPTKLKYIFIGSVVSLVFIFIPLLVVIFVQSLPNPKQLAVQRAPLTTNIYDRNNTLLYQIYASQNRTYVKLSSISQHLKDATIAVEDKRFYKNSGFDIFAIIRSAIASASGKELQGGSTITQQLIKSTLLTPDVSVSRKIKEIILAFLADRIYTKDEILEMYLNQVPYGGTAWGVEAASEIYFGKNVSDLTLAESAYLAGLPRAPSLYSPYSASPKLGKKRQKEVLERMQALGYITSKQAIDAEEKELNIVPMRTPLHAPHFVMYIKDLLVKKYGLPLVEKGGLQVTTSLDLNLQEIAENIVRSDVEKNLYLNLTNGAALVTNPKNGDILAMVGSKDYNEETTGNFNVTTALRQPGSSIKVVTYSAALESKAVTPATIINDSPVTYSIPGGRPYSPVNYSGIFHGNVTLRSALANSINIPAVKTLNKIGIPAMVEMAKKMGITTWKNPENYGLSITLGGAEVKMTDMATVYGVLANGGYRVDLNPILKIEDAKNNIIEEKNEVEKRLVLNPDVAFIISDILSDNNSRSIAFGTNSPLNISEQKVAVKTGTSDNKRDNWTIGYTPSYLVAVWVGNSNNSPMSQTLASGITGAAPIWNKIMSHLLANSSSENFPVPTNIVKKPCLGRIEYFLAGTENSVSCILKPTPTPTQ